MMELAAFWHSDGVWWMEIEVESFALYDMA